MSWEQIGEDIDGEAIRRSSRMVSQSPAGPSVRLRMMAMDGMDVHLSE